MIKLSLFIILGLITMLNAQAAEYQKPELTLELSITGVGVDVRLNDITIEFDRFSGHSTMTYEVNPSVIAGVNELQVIAYPFFVKKRGEGQTKAYHEEAEVKATLYVNEQGDSEHKKMLSQIHLHPGLPLQQAASDSAQIEGLGEVALDDKSQPLTYPSITFNQQVVATRKPCQCKTTTPAGRGRMGRLSKIPRRTMILCWPPTVKSMMPIKTKTVNNYWRCMRHAPQSMPLPIIWMVVWRPGTGL